jgi:hypothetical protein
VRLSQHAYSQIRNRLKNARRLFSSILQFVPNLNRPAK